MILSLGEGCGVSVCGYEVVVVIVNTALKLLSVENEKVVIIEVQNLEEQDWGVTGL